MTQIDVLRYFLFLCAKNPPSDLPLLGKEINNAYKNTRRYIDIGKNHWDIDISIQLKLCEKVLTLKENENQLNAWCIENPSCQRDILRFFLLFYYRHDVIQEIHYPYVCSPFVPIDYNYGLFNNISQQMHEIVEKIKILGGCLLDIPADEHLKHDLLLSFINNFEMLSSLKKKTNDIPYWLVKQIVLIASFHFDSFLFLLYTFDTSNALHIVTAFLLMCGLLILAINKKANLIINQFCQNHRIKLTEFPTLSFWEKSLIGFKGASVMYEKGGIFDANFVKYYKIKIAYLLNQKNQDDLPNDISTTIINEYVGYPSLGCMS